MSAETMSPGPSVATVNAPCAVGDASGEMGFNSFSGPSAFGGTRMEGFDQAAFFETFQMPSPSLDSFAGGKFNPGISALENTRAIWQTPSVLLDHSVEDKAIPEVSAFENTQALWQSPGETENTQLSDIQEVFEYQIFSPPVEPEVTLPQAKTDIAPDTKTETVLDMQEVMSVNPTGELITEPSVTTKESSMPDEMVRQSAITKVREAIKLEEVKMGTKEPEKEAEKLAVKTEEKTAVKTQQTIEKEEVKEEKTNRINHQQAKLYFEHDTNADETRKTAGLNAIEKVSEKITDEKIVEATGQDIAEQMPNPQPKEVKSKIAKDKDGSYESLIRQLKTAGTIYSASEAKDLIEKLVNENHAVRINSVLSSQQATENEVKKVLGGQNTDESHGTLNPLPSP